GLGRKHVLSSDMFFPHPGTASAQNCCGSLNAVRAAVTSRPVRPGVDQVPAGEKRPRTVGALSQPLFGASQRSRGEIGNFTGPGERPKQLGANTAAITKALPQCSSACSVVPQLEPLLTICLAAS